MRGWLALPRVSSSSWLSARGRVLFARWPSPLSRTTMTRCRGIPLVSRDGNVAFVSGPQIAVSSPPSTPSSSSPKTTRDGEMPLRDKFSLNICYNTTCSRLTNWFISLFIYMYIYMVYEKGCSKLYVYPRLVKRNRTNRIRFINSLHSRPFSLGRTNNTT